MQTRRAYKIGERPKEPMEDKNMLMGNMVTSNSNIDVILVGVVLKHGGSVDGGVITMKGEFNELPLTVQNALVELVEEWGYEVVFE
jgi:hypothetical protein